MLKIIVKIIIIFNSHNFQRMWIDYTFLLYTLKHVTFFPFRQEVNTVRPSIRVSPKISAHLHFSGHKSNIYLLALKKSSKHFLHFLIKLYGHLLHTSVKKNTKDCILLTLGSRSISELYLTPKSPLYLALLSPRHDITRL